MAIKWSPGCGCCGSGCERFILDWLPSSPLSRGEYDESDYWQPLTEYLAGDEFIWLSQDPNGDERWFLFRAPQTMFSGPGWTIYEESRYTRVRGVDYIDQVDGWTLFGSWPGDPIQLEEMLTNRRIGHGMGIVSTNEILPRCDDWHLDWQVTINNTQGYPDKEQADLKAKLKFYGSCEFDPLVDAFPKSGIVTRISKAEPSERADNKENCSDWCLRTTERINSFVQSWLEDAVDPNACVTPGAYKPHFKAELGWEIDGQEVFDGIPFVRLGDQQPDGYIPARMARSQQPGDGIVTGRVFPVEGQDVDLYQVDPNLQQFGLWQFGADPPFHYRDLNRIAVCTADGSLIAGGSPFPVSQGDYVRIDDLELANASQDGGFVHVPSSEVGVVDSGFYFGFREEFNTADLGQRDDDIEFQGLPPEIQGRRIAFWVEEYDDLTSPNRDEFYVTFYRVVVNGTLTVENASTFTERTNNCAIVPAYECNCQVLRSYFEGVNLTDTFQYSAEELEQMVAPDPFVFPEQPVPPIVATGQVWDGPHAIASRDQDCRSYTGQYAFFLSYKVYEDLSLQVPDLDGFGGGVQQVLSYGVTIRYSVVWQENYIKVLDALGSDRFIEAASTIKRYTPFIEANPPVFPTIAEAEQYALNFPNLTFTQQDVFLFGEFTPRIDLGLWAEGRFCGSLPLSSQVVAESETLFQVDDSETGSCQHLVVVTFPGSDPTYDSFISQSVLIGT